MAQTIVDLSLPEELLREIDDLAKTDDKSRNDVLEAIARRYVSERRWARVQAEVSSKARAYGLLTEDDVEELMDSLED